LALVGDRWQPLTELRDVYSIWDENKKNSVPRVAVHFESGNGAGSYWVRAWSHQHNTSVDSICAKT